MQISAIEAITKGMVTDRAKKILDEKKYTGCSSIDITLRTVLHRSDVGTKIKDGDSFFEGVSESYNLSVEPQETVYLISEEFISVPAGYVAYVFLKNRYSQRGLLAFNTGIVDGGYNGPIATLLTNISSETIDLKSVNGGRFFRVVFHKIDMNEDEVKAVKNTYYEYEEYRYYKARDLLKLPRFFQNPDKIKKQITESLNEKALNYGVMKLGAIIGVAGLLMILVPPLTTLTTNAILGSVPLGKELWELKNEQLEQRISELETKLSSPGTKGTCSVGPSL
ncbi:dCTP deaminase domain-containing protein [Alteromonas confluentis]|uniref:Uncharacterized protein n=1 Tax=Alteromonas confluentis TaxID=1656094 RepID=A0A1E7ZD55_9ALTE|nr:hypothetical protein [Alteromonas confluentis]OFC71382.1 hypothetical protein BFC18_09550 [Alteromonas confluentis]